MQPFKKDKLWILCQDELKPAISGDWFEQAFWLNQGRLLGANSGRGSAWVIKSEYGKWVLRHYYRGGMYAKLNRDQYLWTGLHNTRAIKEFRLLQQLQEMGLPSPKPIAAQVNVNGLFYRNDLIMEHIKHQQTFAQFLSEGKDSGVWKNIGSMIKKYHQQGVYHADLNAHNILLAEQDTYLIDFDKGKIKPPKSSWQQANLNRLKRSIEKETEQSCEHELKAAWHDLLDAYHAG